MNKIILNNGMEIPQLGLGVFQIENVSLCEQVVSEALALGYQLIDTAAAYHNEEAVGAAIKKSGIPREEIFITSKIWVQDFGYEKTKRAVETALQNLDVEYIDLMLLHQQLSDYYGSWRALQEYFHSGIIKSIGVSNFYADRLADLCANFETAPAVNQIECHPFYQRQYDIEVMNKLGVAVMAWAPLAEGGHDIWNNMTLKSIADKHHKTVAQVALRFSIQRNVIVIPKTVHPNRMLENMSIWDFELDETDMEKLKTLDTGKTKIIDHLNVETVRFLNKHKVHD